MTDKPKVELAEQTCNQILDFVEEAIYQQLHGNHTGEACRIEIISEQGILTTYLTCSPLPPLQLDTAAPDQS